MQSPWLTIIASLGALYNLGSDYQITFYYELIDYPTWNGSQIQHDPLFTAYASFVSPPPLFILYIIISVVIIAGVVIVGLLFLKRRRTKH